MRLPPEKRSCWEDHVMEFSFAHNTVHHENIACTPFELGHEAPAQTLTRFPATTPIHLDDDSIPRYYGRLKQASQAYQEIAKSQLGRAQDD